MWSKIWAKYKKCEKIWKSECLTSEMGMGFCKTFDPFDSSLYRNLSVIRIPRSVDLLKRFVCKPNKPLYIQTWTVNLVQWHLRQISNWENTTIKRSHRPGISAVYQYQSHISSPTTGYKFRNNNWELFALSLNALANLRSN